jgi:glutaredoxin
VSEPRLPEVWQTEWCPHSQKVREALTELGVAFVARQVPADQEDRDELERELGTREIPAVRLADGTTLTGDDHEIIAALRSRFAEPAGAEEHREKAREKADAG